MKLYKDSSNNIFAYELDGSQDHLIGNKIAITEEEVTSIHNQKTQDELDKLTYDEKRALEYPRIGDQLDMLWHAIDSGTLDKTSDFYTTLKQVKDTYPKESS
jgi:hypothetical protein